MKLMHLDKVQLLVSQPGKSALQGVLHLVRWNPKSSQVRALLHDLHLMPGQLPCCLHDEPQLIQISLTRKQGLSRGHLHQ